jgi:predicted transposase YbfD/YdcC
VLATGSEMLVQLKANHPTLLAAVQDYCQSHTEDDHSHSSDIGWRNRLEGRRVRLWQLPEGTGPEPWHDHFKVALEVRRHTECFDTTRKEFVLRQEEPAYYLATCTGSAQALGQPIREHWGIENRLHYVLDESLDEDASRIRRNPGIFALTRQFALNLLRYNGQTNIHAALYNNALCLDRLLAYRGIWER